MNIYHLIAALTVFAAVIFGFALLYGHYLRKKIIIPLRKMKEYAERVSEGNFDRPLDGERSSELGVLSDSFDVILEELSLSREREAALLEKQREFVTTLGQELKTPVTGIKLVTQHLKSEIPGAGLSEDTSGFAAKIDSIYDKAEQIEEILTELSTSALDELGEVRVNPADEKAQILNDILKRFDDRGLVVLPSIPDVLICIDARRMSQVIGNIIVNSYQYADTQIDVGYLLGDDFLQMKISDHGPGVATDEIDHITDRFYRSRLGAGRTEGRGMGLFNARMLMEKMGGSLSVANTGEGLCVTLLIPLS